MKAAIGATQYHLFVRSHREYLRKTAPDSIHPNSCLGAASRVSALRDSDPLPTFALYSPYSPSVALWPTSRPRGRPLASQDPDGNHKIELADLARVFAPVRGVSAKQAYNIAYVVMYTADTDYFQRASALKMIKKVARGKAGMRDQGIEMKKDATDANSGIDFAECARGDRSTPRIYTPIAPYTTKIPSSPTHRLCTSIVRAYLTPSPSRYLTPLSVLSQVHDMHRG